MLLHCSYGLRLMEWENEKMVGAEGFEPPTKAL